MTQQKIRSNPCLGTIRHEINNKYNCNWNEMPYVKDLAVFSSVSKPNIYPSFAKFQLVFFSNSKLGFVWNNLD
jgi:hypothetical protein